MMKWTRRDFPTGPVIVKPAFEPEASALQGQRSFVLHISNSLRKVPLSYGPTCYSLEFFGLVYRTHQHYFSDLNIFL